METSTEVVAKEPEVEAEVPEVPEVEAKEPPTPSHKPTVVVDDARPPPTLDADFWGGMLLTKRKMDREAKSLRYSNLVVFK